MILLEIDVAGYVQSIINVGCLLVGGWGFYRTFREIKKTNDDEVKRQARIDAAVKIVEEGHVKWDAALADMETGRQRLMMRYDGRLDEQDAKIQDILSILVELLQSNDIILDALVSAGIGNGDIKNRRDDMSHFIAEQIKKG